jgi:hypothetical protein
LAILSRNKRRARKVLALTVPTRTPSFQDWAEFVDRAGQNVVNLQLAIFFFGCCGLVLDFEREAFLVSRLMAFDRKVAGTAFAEKHQGFIDGDAGKPGGKSRLTLKTFEMNKSLLERLLNGVFGILGILEPAEGDMKHFLLVALEKSFEGSAGATDCFGDESLVLGVEVKKILSVFGS